MAVRGKFWQGLEAWRENFSDRLTQSRVLTADIVRLSGPMIVLGDFNALESSPVVQIVKSAGLQDTFSLAGRGYGYSHGHALDRGLDLLRIDHILVSDGFHVQIGAVGGGEASEHNPVIADMVLLP